MTYLFTIWIRDVIKTDTFPPQSIMSLGRSTSTIFEWGALCKYYVRRHITYCLSLSLSLSSSFVIVWRAKNYLVFEWCALSRCAPSYHLLLQWIKPRRRILKLVKSIIEKINSVNPSGNSCSKITIEKAQFWYILSQERNENRSYSGKHPTRLIKKIQKH